MYHLHEHARHWGVRPSELVGVADPFAAYCLDDAVSMLGMYIESVVQSEEERLSKSKNKDPKFIKSIIQNRVKKILGIPREYRRMNA